jgi:hypothetical protein
MNEVLLWIEQNCKSSLVHRHELIMRWINSWINCWVVALKSSYQLTEVAEASIQKWRLKLLLCARAELRTVLFDWVGWLVDARNTTLQARKNIVN